MATWSQSHLLQSLGWAILNSFWQMALLWCLFTIFQLLFRIPSSKIYQTAVTAMFTGFGWFIVTFMNAYNGETVSFMGSYNSTIFNSGTQLNGILLSASLSYLGLLMIPSYKLLRNWQFVQQIKKYNLHKVGLDNRLFVKNISGLLGIRKKVFIYVSGLVNSPITIGYLKPIILLPVAALNHLSIAQVESIILHELVHIRRYDYLFNLMISVISTTLYFNPFVKLFMKSIEEQRENCCDQMVLQFGYDKIDYASALLTLEKLSAHQQLLALGASGKTYLVTRIEKIIGMEKKKGIRKNQLVSILTALFCIIVFNSILIIREKKQNGMVNDYTLSSPFALFEAGNIPTLQTKYPLAHSKSIKDFKATSATAKSEPDAVMMDPAIKNDRFHPNASDLNLVQVGLDEADLHLTTDEKNNVKSTVAATKKVLSTLQWTEVENNFIGDAMNEQEKLKAKQEYLNALNLTVNWKNIEENMIAKYEHIDWKKVNGNLSNALFSIRLDSLQENLSSILIQLDKANEAQSYKATSITSPLPDQSVAEIQKVREELRNKIKMIRAIKINKKIIHL